MSAPAVPQQRQLLPLSALPAFKPSSVAAAAPSAEELKVSGLEVTFISADHGVVPDSARSMASAPPLIDTSAVPHIWGHPFAPSPFAQVWMCQQCGINPSSSDVAGMNCYCVHCVAGPRRCAECNTPETEAHRANHMRFASNRSRAAYCCLACAQKAETARDDSL